MGLKFDYREKVVIEDEEEGVKKVSISRITCCVCKKPICKASSHLTNKKQFFLKIFLMAIFGSIFEKWSKSRFRDDEFKSF